MSRSITGSAAAASPTSSAANASAASDGGRFTFRAGLVAVERGEDHVLERSGVLRQPDRLLRATWRETMHTDLSALSVQRDGGLTETPADLHVTADQTGRDRVAVPPQRNERVRRHGPHFDDLGGERNRRQPEQRFSVGQLTDRGAVPATSIRGAGTPRVQAACASAGVVTRAVRHHDWVR